MPQTVDCLPSVVYRLLESFPVSCLCVRIARGKICAVQSWHESKRCAVIVTRNCPTVFSWTVSNVANSRRFWNNAATKHNVAPWCALMTGIKRRFTNNEEGNAQLHSFWIILAWLVLFHVITIIMDKRAFTEVRRNRNMKWGRPVLVERRVRRAMLLACSRCR